MIPVHLASTQAKGLHPGHPIAQYEIGKYRNFVYLILDWASKKSSIVDPQENLNEILAGLNQYGFVLESILITHSHHDHIAGVGVLLKHWPRLPLYIHPFELHRMVGVLPNGFSPHLISDGEVIKVGALGVRAIHTPGHSAGECCYYLEHDSPYLFSGDTVFIRDCGRTDLSSGSNAQMFESLQRLKQLPHSTVILPGHHYAQECATTLGKELVESPPFRCKTVAEIEALT